MLFFFIYTLVVEWGVSGGRGRQVVPGYFFPYTTNSVTASLVWPAKQTRSSGPQTPSGLREGREGVKEGMWSPAGGLVNTAQWTTCVVLSLYSYFAFTCTSKNHNITL